MKNIYFGFIEYVSGMEKQKAFTFFKCLFLPFSKHHFQMQKINLVHSQRLKKNTKDFQPYYFAVPAHIFMEKHFSDTFTKDTEAPQMTLNDFEKNPCHNLEFHTLGLSYSNNRKVETIIKSSTNPMIIEYTSNQRLIQIVHSRILLILNLITL